MSIMQRTLSFYPITDGSGKWHASMPLSQRPLCGFSVELDFTVAPIITNSREGNHPILCKRCLRLLRG